MQVYAIVSVQNHARRLSTAEVAEKAGIHRDTLLRWLRSGEIPEPSRDRHGWRVFSTEEATAVVTYATSTQATPSRPAELKDRPAPSPAVERLHRIDWDFHDAKTSYLTHGLHPYPAKYIPQIPNALIQEFSTVGETVGDIFCGSGTTLVEALLLKRNAVGLDANPLACLISEAKTTRFAEGDKEALLVLAERAIQLANTIPEDDQPTLFPSAEFLSKAPRPAYEAIGFWFQPFVVEELAEVLQWCRELPTQACRSVALASFSSIIVNVSKQDSDTRYVRRDKNLAPGDVLRRFAQALTENAHAVEKLSDVLEPNVTCRVIQADILSAPTIPALDLVVCSPPYPNAYSYHLYHMTRMVWLGMDQPEFKKREIGSHRKFSSKARNGATVETFRAEMSKVFLWLKASLRRGRHACFVVGNSIIRGETHDNAEVLKQAAVSAGFAEVARLDRNMKDTSKAFNPRIGKIKTEKIVIFRNRGVNYL
jgi:site-specific DNA-methyltransferase (cytosine-N4-specific)